MTCELQLEKQRPIYTMSTNTHSFELRELTITSGHSQKSCFYVVIVDGRQLLPYYGELTLAGFAEFVMEKLGK